MALLGWLKQKNLTEIIPLLDQMKVLYGQRISYNVLMDQIIAPLPEEKITLEDIQRNPTWMEKIQDVFQRHGAGDYAGFVDGVNVLL